MRRSLGLLLAMLPLLPSCYGPARTQPDHVTLETPGATRTVSWGRERSLELVHEAGHLYVLAVEQPRCRSFTSGTLEVVDVKLRSKTSDLQPGGAVTAMVLGAGLAIGFLIIPPVLDTEYKPRDYAVMGVGGGVFIGSAAVILVDRALPRSRSKPIVRAAEGGSWAADSEACGAPRNLDQPLTVSASDGETQVSWVVRPEGPRTQLSAEILDSVEAWANACQIEIQLHVGLSGEPMPADLRSYEQERIGRIGLGDYAGGDVVEQGDGAGRGHDTAYGEGARLAWKPDTSRIKARADARISETTRLPIDACLSRAQREFEEPCRALAREASHGECEEDCKEDRDLQDCVWLREDCGLLGGTSEECSIVYDKCLRDKQLDPPNLELCTSACLDEHPSVVRSRAECSAQWQALP